jgi:demethylmenaquinone methyltransferase/2-methoxy-6-polyprenyl-1,4-benzoquinol methylase
MNKEEFVYQTFQNISEEYDRMNDIESFRLHRRWKAELVRQTLEAWRVPGGAATSGQDAPFATPRVLDIACGTGDISFMLAEAESRPRVVGLDFSENMLAVAQRRLDERTAGGAGVPLPDVRFIHGSAMALPFEAESFDAATISFGLRNMPDYERVLREMLRVLRPAGKICCLEASYPTNPLIKPFFRIYFKHIMPAMGAAIAHHRAEYQWLNDSTEAFLGKDELAALMRDVGMADVGYRSFLFGSAAIHAGRKPEGRK